MLSFFLQKKRFSWFTLFLLIVAGFYVLFNISRESLPEITIPIIGVTTVYPGASSLDVEELVTNPLEKQFTRSLKDVKNMNSTSREGVSSITIEFDTTVDLDNALRSVRDEVAKVKNDVPKEAQDPLVQEFSFDDQPVFVVSLSSRAAYTALSDTNKKVEDIFNDISGVSRVEVSGIPDEQITIIFDQEALARHGLNVADVSRTIAQNDVSFPIGSIVQKGVEYNITVDSSLENIDDIKNIILQSSSSGSPLYVKDVARIDDGLAPYKSLSRLSVDGKMPQQAITFSLFKQVGFDITQVTHDARVATENLKNEFPQTSFVTLIDSGNDVNENISNLTQSAVVTIALVFIVLFLGLGLREAIIAGLAVPLSFLLSFIGLDATGNSINFISLFALILAIGLLVDASVVIIEGISIERARGKNPQEAIKSTLKEFAAPVIAGTMTTLVVFIPLANISGVTGQFIRAIPLTVIFVLIASLIVALVFVPMLTTISVRLPHRSWLTHQLERLDAARARTIERLNNWYRHNLKKLLANKKRERQLISSLIGLFILSLILVGSGLIKPEFFPADDFDQINISAEIPLGSQLDDMSAALKPVENYLTKQDHVNSFVTQIKPTTASITVILEDSDYGNQVLKDIRAKLEEDHSGTIFQASSQQNGGPSSGAPLSIEVTGDSYDQVERVARSMEKIVRNIPGTTNVESSVSATRIGFNISLDTKKVRDVGLDATRLGSILRSAVFGNDVAEITRDGEDIDVTIISGLNTNYTTLETTNHVSFDSIRSFPLQTPMGEVPLGALMNEELVANAPALLHKDGDRIVTVSSDLKDGVILADVDAAFEQQAKNIENIDAVDWKYGGDTERSAESGKELGVALLLGIFLVIGVLIFQFDSLRNTFFIISVVPLGLIGVLFGLFAFGQTLSFTAMLGFVALVGIVVNNSIILIDVIVNLQKRNPDRDITDIVVDGSVSRIRPILLTTATTVMGMLPLLFTSPVWKPLALAIICGLLFAVVLTLFLIPLLYTKWGSTEV